VEDKLLGRRVVDGGRSHLHRVVAVPEFR
jgi:hypothetical protein